MKQDSISWSELAQLTHATQVEQFKWCACEDLDDREQAPYADCPVQDCGFHPVSYCHGCRCNPCTNRDEDHE